jgi:DNA-binding response OmpR family regulator
MDVSMNPKLLLITDRADHARLQAQMLVHSGIEVSVLNHTIARSRMNATDLMDYSLILIHMFEEEKTGLEICRTLRAGYYSPILFLIFDRDERTQLAAYEAGADDCLVQPISVNVLMAKVKAWLRRSSMGDCAIDHIEAYSFRFDPVKSEVITPDETLVHLSQLEARLLHLLIVNSGRIVATDLIIQRVWPDNCMGDGDRHLLKALVHRLRRKIEQDPACPQYIHTVPYQGYSFRQEI